MSVSTLPAGAGPRQLVRRPGTNHAYVGDLAASLLSVREEPPGTFAVENSVPATLEPGGENLSARRPAVPVEPWPREDHGIQARRRAPAARRTTPTRSRPTNARPCA
ncbi:hypothetical protein [Amycolatopsis sp. WAC 04182]|uniref:hypothetical protein n=1 Tax=Amycolatopsis sp. WAC 04182 TaxID=2203198 RepID=UPI001F352C89|nr:hypothetical protein [Amycolatopsis sp. WAC 04182]